MRRPITFLLMFFLLLTQQVAMSHAVTHLAPAALASAAGEERTKTCLKILKICISSAMLSS